MAAMYPDFSADFSPRGMVQHALRRSLGMGSGPDTEWLGRCMQCGNCTRSCPEGVDCAGVIADLREERRLAGGQGFRFCVACGRELAAAPIRQWLDSILNSERERRTDFIPGFLKKIVGEEEAESAPGTVRHLCLVCRRQAYAAGNG
jgi:Fe-S oxidoreductase